MNAIDRDVAQLSVERCVDRGEWDAFVDRNDGPVFARWEWGDAVASDGHDRWYLAARDDGDVVGALPLFHMESRLFGSKLVSPPYAARGSVVLGDDRSAAAKRALLERTRRLADDLEVDFVSLRGADLGSVEGFEKRNRFVTFDVPLSDDPERTRENVKESRRRQIDQAAESSLTYSAGTTMDDLREYYDLYLESMRGHGTPPLSFRFFRILWDELYPAGDLHLGMVRKDGSLVNGILDLASGSTVYQWGVITDYEHRDLNGGSLALWKSLERACEAGYDSYEMGRTREGSGVYMFKKSWGGDKVWYDDYHYFPDGEGSLPHPEDETYDLAKQVWRKLPIPVTRVLGPHIRKNISL